MRSNSALFFTKLTYIHVTSVRKQIQSMRFYRHSKLTHAIASIALRVLKSEKRKFSLRQ